MYFNCCLKVANQFCCKTVARSCFTKHELCETSNVEPAYPVTTDGRSSDLVQRHDITDLGLTQLVEHCVVILPEKSASVTRGTVKQSLRSTHVDVITDCVVGKVWPLTMASVEIGFLFESRPEARSEECSDLSRA